VHYSYLNKAGESTVVSNIYYYMFIWHFVLHQQESDEKGNQKKKRWELGTFSSRLRRRLSWGDKAKFVQKKKQTSKTKKYGSKKIINKKFLNSQLNKLLAFSGFIQI
jgi:hypothetical protein